MGAFVGLGVLEWFTLSPETIRVIQSPNGQPLLEVSMRGAALAVLVFFAFRSWIQHRREMLDQPQQAKDGLSPQHVNNGRAGDPGLAGDPRDSERGRSRQQ